ncbi:MAG: acyltransferase [Salinivirgaceae bacterium]|jgi:acetyltransferase-like isoleucine patch superfamily enzyme|nr:acyltransferase [Salinivirgaceae bacterium]
MRILEYYYRSKGKEIPYYAKYSLHLILWRPIRKYLNVVIIPNIPFNGIRIAMYRLIGFKIGKNTFIGMKCYLDDTEPSHTVIGSNVTISYGCYFALHGKGQQRLFIEINDGVYIGMRCNIITRKEKLIIGEKSIIGAASLVNCSVEKNTTVVGVPAKKI